VPSAPAILAPGREVDSGFSAVTKLHGVISAVSKSLGLSHEHVRQVAYGNRTSARVKTALLAEIERRGSKGAAERAQ
jgi:hypothetical protein